MTHPFAGPAPPVSVRGLQFRYPGSQHDVLRVPFLDVPARGMTAITGPSGAGKSTLIELLAGTLREPYAGSIQVLGIEWMTLTRDADRQRQLRRIGLIPQDYGLLHNRTPAQMLDQDLADAGTAPDERPERIRGALAAVDLAAVANRAISHLSGGQRQRVAIARMLARRVELVIADEPTANLDPALTASAMALFRRLAQQIPVMIITHDPQVANACDRIIVLQSAVQEPDSQPAPASRPRSWRGLAILVAIGAVAASVAALFIAGILPPQPGHHPASAASVPTPHPTRTTSPGAATRTTALVRRMPPGGPRGYRVLLPAAWKFRNLSYSSDHATHLWYDPADPRQKMRVIISGCTGCAASIQHPNQPDPLQLVPAGAATRFTINKWKAGFRADQAGDPYPDNGLVIILHQGGQIQGYITVNLWLPANQHALATAILDSFKPPASPRPTTAPAPLPVVYDCRGTPQTTPATYTLACADGGIFLSNITWSSWSASGAEGTGQLGINDCQPDCAQGTFSYTPATVTLSSPQTGTSGPYFTQLQINDPSAPSGMATSWPVGTLGPGS